MRYSISPDFRRYLLDRFPALANNQHYLRFALYLLFGADMPDHPGNLFAGKDKLLEVIGYTDAPQRFHLERFLVRFRRDVFAELAWSNYLPTEAARIITSRGIDAALSAKLSAELAYPPSEPSRLVEIYHGTNFQKYRAQHLRPDTDNLKRENIQSAQLVSASQANVFHFLNGDSPNNLRSYRTPIARKLRDNEHAINAAVAALSSAQQANQRRILHAIRDEPEIFYKPSSKGRTARLHAASACALSLKREVRSALFSGWYEADLRASQFAIFAGTLQAPLALELLQQGKCLWQTLYQHATGSTSEPPPKAKQALKNALYTLVFGGDAHYAKLKLVRQNLAQALEHPIMLELLDKRSHWYAEIGQAKGASDVWGNWSATAPDREPRAIGATVMQSIELEIMSAAIEVARQSEQSQHYRVMAWIHDALIISFNSRKHIHQAQARLTEAVTQRALELGITSSLDWKQL